MEAIILLMKKLKQITALAKRITIRGPITRVKVRRILPKGKVFFVGQTETLLRKSL